MKITPIRINAIILTVTVVVFGVFIAINEQNHRTRQNQYVVNHAKVISDSIWDFEREGPEAYLDLAAKLYNYEAVSVLYPEDDEAFITVRGPEVNSLDMLLIQIGFIQKYSIEEDVIYRDRKIATLKIIALNKTFHLYFLMFVFLLMFLAVVHFFIQTLYSKQILEEKVSERTQELSKSEEKYRELVEGTQELIVSMDKEGLFTFLNHMAGKILGVTPEEAIGMSAFKFIYPDDIEYTEKWFNEGVSKKQKNLKIDNRQVNQKTGEVRDIMWSSTFHYDEFGKLVSVSGVGRDITDKNKAESERIQLEKQLRQSQKIEALGTLVGGIAHDFNNMLASIFGYTELLKIETEGDPKIQKRLNPILAVATRAKDLVQHLLIFSRKSDVEKHVMDIAPIIKEAIKFTKATAPSTISIESNISQSGCTILADVTQVHQVLMNLFTNAIHAMKEAGGVLKVELKKTTVADRNVSLTKKLAPGNYIMISVSDNGAGIPKAHQEKIFDPFFTTKGKEEGTGLGLSVTYGIVHEMHGHILVYSEEGIGTSFNIFLPEHRYSNSPVKNEQTMEIHQGHGTILLVDDEVDITIWMSEMLEDMGYTVVSTQQPEEALTMVQREPDRFNLVITDLTMPGMVGTTLASAIHEVRVDLPIILCTGFIGSISQDVIDKSGIAKILLKPVVSTELSDQIKKIIG